MSWLQQISILLVSLSYLTGNEAFYLAPTRVISLAQTQNGLSSRQRQTQQPHCYDRRHLSLHMIFPSNNNAPKIPKTKKERYNQAISSIQRALASPKNSDFPLIECEFPALEALNKLGDGSLRSTQQAEQANLEFSKQLVQSLSLPLIGSKICLLTSSAASTGFAQKAKALVGSNSFCSLRNTAEANQVLETLNSKTVCILLNPSTRSDYQTAKTLALKKQKVVLVNGLAKDPSSVSGRATMAYFLKPLTYNSQVVGFLIRAYPGPWTTLDGVSNQVLQTRDESILVGESNTPDLRESGKLVQKSVDERAIRNRGR